MPIKEKQTCNMHTKEKEKSGTCCQVGDVQENAEALTYEQSFMVRTSSVKELVKQENECYPGQPDET